MKILTGKKKAWTLAELGIAFIILSIFMSISLSAFNKTASSTNKKMYYTALKNIMNVTGEIIAAGKVDASGNLVGDYYSNAVNIVNTVGTNSSTSTNYTKPNFTLTNGLSFYGLGTAIGSPTTIYVDVNGKTGISKDPIQNSKNPDVFRINIYKTGLVEPYTSATPSNNPIEGTMVLAKVTVWGRVDGATTALAGCVKKTTGQNYPCVLSTNMTFTDAKAWMDSNSSTYNATIEYVTPLIIKAMGKSV